MAAFTRDDLVNYEKTVVEIPPVEPIVTPEDVTPPESSEESSPSSESPPDDPANDGLAENAESAPADADPESDTEDQEQVEKPRKTSAQERIEDLVTERNALRKYGEHLLARLEELGKPNSSRAAPTPPVVENENPPSLEDHQFDPVAFAKAQNEWIQKQVDKRVNQAVQKLSGEQQLQLERSTFEQKVNAFKETHKDFDIVIANPDLPALSSAAARQIIKSDFGPDVTYYFGTHPDVAARIAKMSPEQQLVAIGRIEAQVSQPPSAPPEVKQPAQVVKQPKTVTKAPPPPKPTIGSTAAQKSPSDMSMDEWVAHERGKKLADRQARIKLRNAMR